MNNISIIVAIARNGVIGNDNRLLWHIPEDLKRFKSLTTGHPVIMGRKTFESIGRPLPRRRNIVITRQKDFAPEGCETAHSLEEAIGMCDPRQELFIIGGEQIYRQALPLAGRLYLTLLEKEYEGDTFFPEIDFNQWSEVYRHTCAHGTNYAFPFTFVDYERKK